jgi:mono/diheme cytochrome c family protein
MMLMRTLLAQGAVVAASGLIANAGAADRSRGELLYNTHCIACHTTQMHWRNQRLAADWKTLTFQVRRWQDSIQLNWTEEDIDAVASYLNRHYYEFPEKEKDKAISSNR